MAWPSAGQDRFSVVGHDRGALVAFRAAMDHPDAVERLVVMDGLPVIEHLERLNEAFVRTWWHWWFLGQTDKPAEPFINTDPGRWYRAPSPAEMGEDNHADVWAAFRDPAVVHGMCEDYRAGLRADRAHEEADRAAGGRRPFRSGYSAAGAESDRRSFFTGAPTSVVRAGPVLFVTVARHGRWQGAGHPDR